MTRFLKPVVIGAVFAFGLAVPMVQAAPVTRALSGIAALAPDAGLVTRTHGEHTGCGFGRYVLHIPFYKRGEGCHFHRGKHTALCACPKPKPLKRYQGPYTTVPLPK